MKSLAIMAAIAAFTTSVTATDIGIRVGRNVADTNYAGVTVSQPLGAFGVEAAADRSTAGTTSFNQYSVVGTRDLTKFYGATLTAKVGAAYIDSADNNTGVVLVAGAGISYPISTTTSVVADYAFTGGNSAVTQFSGNRVSFGAKYSF